MPKHILFLEDDPNMQKLVATAIEKAGFTYDWYENPKIALRELQENPKHYDAIVSDWNMPGKNGMLSMNGDDFLIRVRHGGRVQRRFGIPQDIPFVMCSSYDEQSKINRALELGANFYQIKGYGHSLSPMIDYLNSI